MLFNTWYLCSLLDIIIGFLVWETFLTKFKSVISNEAILYIGHFNFSKKSTAVSSNGVLNTFIPKDFPYLKVKLLFYQLQI